MRIAILLLALFLAACGKPVPPEKSAYVGLWESEDMYLEITQGGSVRYKRFEGNSTRKVNGPLKGFIGNHFEVGIGPASTKFIVERPPYQQGGKWKMVVDGVELTRTQ